MINMCVNRFRVLSKKMMNFNCNFLSVKVFLFLFAPFWGMGLLAQGQSDRPNIVWLVSEDNSKHYLNLYNENGAPMPNIEGLAEKGVVFNNAFSNAPVCSVARSTIITGCYAPRVGAQYHRKIKPVPMPEGLEMFPYYLRNSGYYTTNNAKEDYNFITSDDVWDESSKQASYEHRKSGQPFFHVQNFGGTHEGQLHFSEKNMQNTPTHTNTKDVPVFPYHPDTPTFRYTNAHYRDLHTKVDTQIGQFLKKMEKQGLMENTIIFYYGDHGGVLPRSKGYVYESGLHVPLVIYVPEKYKDLTPLARGSRTDAFVQFVDFAPTVLNLAGISVPKQMDGRPFLGEGVTKDSLEQRNTTFGYADRFDEKYDMVRSIRKGPYKYIRNYQPFNIDGLYNFYRYKMLAYREWRNLFEAGKLDSVQEQFFRPRTAEALYDLEKDPYETQNLMDDPSSRSVLVELRSKMKAQIKAMPDLSFYPEPYFLENGLSDPVQFGREHQRDIAQLADVADLALLPFSEAKGGLKTALNSNNPWHRYWGLIVCSAFGEKAAPYFDKARLMAMDDPENLVRIRAVEFLGLNNRTVDNTLILDILKNTKSESEALLILNSVALLKMVSQEFELRLPANLFDPNWMEEKRDLVRRRVDFINGER